MSHGHTHRAPAESAVAKALARASGTWGGFQVSGYQAWHQLDADKRFELVERVLGDCFPAAL